MRDINTSSINTRIYDVIHQDILLLYFISDGLKVRVTTQEINRFICNEFLMLWMREREREKNMLIDFYACAPPPIHMSLFSLFEHLKA